MPDYLRRSRAATDSLSHYCLRTHTQSSSSHTPTQSSGTHRQSSDNEGASSAGLISTDVTSCASPKPLRKFVPLPEFALPSDSLPDCVVLPLRLEPNFPFSHDLARSQHSDYVEVQAAADRLSGLPPPTPIFVALHPPAPGGVQNLVSVQPRNKELSSLADLDRRLSVGLSSHRRKDRKSPTPPTSSSLRPTRLRFPVNRVSASTYFYHRRRWEQTVHRSPILFERSDPSHMYRDRICHDDRSMGGWSSIASTDKDSLYSAYARKRRRRRRSRGIAHAQSSKWRPPLDAQATLHPGLLYGNGLGPLALPMGNSTFEPMMIAPVASRSMLTCSDEFRKQFPFVYQGLCKGILDIQRLIAHEIVIPIREDVNVRRSMIRSRKAVTRAICDQVWRSLQGRFPDPSVAPKLIKKMAEYFYDKIEYGIKDAEDEQSFVQWFFRFEVENAIDLRQSLTIVAGKNTIIANVEGTGRLKRKKGDFFNVVSPDSVTLNIECVVKALFLNGGHLSEINSDSIFIDHVSAGESRFARQFLGF